MKYKEGDKVEILGSQWVFFLKHRKKPVYGYVDSIDGEYIYVRPTWCAWVLELYSSEIREV